MFSYVGGKYRQAKWITSQMSPVIKNYAEVFGGAMWVYINGDVYPNEVCYNDYNSQMANLFSCCNRYDEFIPILESYKAQDEDLFYKFKKDIVRFMKDGSKIDMPDFDLAHKYVYIITQCFSGIMSEKVKFVDLKDKYKSKYYSFLGRLKNSKIQKKLSKIKVYNLSFEDFIPIMDNEKTLLYLDPPYYGTENLYAFHNFVRNDHKKLADILNNCKSKWILSYYEFPEMLEWYPKDKYKWIYKEYKKASMATKGKKQSIGIELLIIKR